jgi:hypothetical protein
MTRARTSDMEIKDMRGVQRAGVAALLAGAALLWPVAASAQVIEDELVDEPVPPPVDPDAANRQAAIDLAAELNAGLRRSGPGVAAECAHVSFVATGSRVSFNNPTTLGIFVFSCLSSVANTVTTITGEHRQFQTEITRTIDNRLGQPGEVEVRGLATGQAPLRITATSLAQARTGLLTGSRTATGRRYFAGTAIQTGGGPELITDRILAERLTRRQLVVLGFVEALGPGMAAFGEAGQCPTPTSLAGCQSAGGVYEVPGLTSNTTVLSMRILTISQQVERTITGGTTFFDLPLTALPTGAIHAAAPQAGFGASGRFLRRLTDGPGDGALRRGAFWGEA